MSLPPNWATLQQPPPRNTDPARRCVQTEAKIEAARARFFDLSEAIEDRAVAGKERYGDWLYTMNGRSMAIDAYQEALDLLVYLQGEVLEGCEEARADFVIAMGLAERIRLRLAKAKGEGK